MRKFLFCVCIILVLVSITLLIYQSGIEQALANKAESDLTVELSVAFQENLNEQEKSEEQMEADTEIRSDYP